MSDYYTGDSLQIGTETQLLIDDTIIEDRWRLTRVLHQPDKFARNPILVADKPWESGMLHGANVIWDQERELFRMWYLCFNNSNYHYGSGPVTYVCYAESEDGYNWQKPLTERCAYGEYRKTNIVHYGVHDQGTYFGAPNEEGATRIQNADKSQVFKDENDPDPARRYKMISLEGRPRLDLNEVHTGVQLLCSEDGFDWKLEGDKPLLDHASDCLNHLVRDTKNQRWLMFCRPPMYHSGRDHGPRNIRRRVAAMTSEDLINWSYPRVVCYPDEYDLPDYDHVLVFPYGNIFVMFYGAMEGDTTGRWELRLATSNDGFHWERYHTRETYLARGDKGAWDGGGVLPSTPPIAQGERLLFYYNGTLRGQEEQGDFLGGIGLATIVRDRFVEQRAGETNAYLLTKEFVLEGNRLEVNIEPHKSTNGVNPLLRAEMLRHSPFGQHWDFQQAFEGFSLEDCDPLAVDHTAATVTWNGKSDLSALRGKSVYLRFELRHMGLFSFRIADS